MKNKLFDIRRDYKLSELSEDLMPDNPFDAFKNWIKAAIDSKKVEDPTAMVLATAGLDYKISSRVVLLKEIDHTGFYFFTNYNSKKGKQIKENPNASLLFFWPGMERQIRIEGTIKTISDEESERYFLSRPFESQVSAIVSPQSEPISNREIIKKKAAELVSNNSEKTLQRPNYWGGYCLIPELIEFWQGRPNRLHDRIEYRLERKRWVKYRLAP